MPLESNTDEFPADGSQLVPELIQHFGRECPTTGTPFSTQERWEQDQLFQLEEAALLQGPNGRGTQNLFQPWATPGQTNTADFWNAATAMTESEPVYFTLPTINPSQPRRSITVNAKKKPNANENRW